MFGSFFDIERLIHSVKTAIACILGFLITRLFGFPADQWIVITIIVVMCAQIYVGSVMGKAYLRFLGTLIGCLFAAITLISVGDSTLSAMTAIAFSSFIFSFISAGRESLSYMGTLGAVTTAIIMLSPKPTLSIAAERFLEISVGLFIATLVSQFILPIHARTHLRRSQAATLKQLNDYYKTIIMDRKIHDVAEIHDLNETIVSVLIKQRQLAKESVREPFGTTFDPSHFLQSLYAERDILRAITYMYSAFTHVDTVEKYLSHSIAFENFNQAILKTFQTLIKAIESPKNIQEQFYVPSIKPLKDELEKNLAITSREELIYIDGFLFAAEILVDNLTKLARLFGVPVYAA